MDRIPQAFIDDLLARLDIVSVVDSRVKLKRTGKNYAACCPFHQEKTPSFSVSPDKQFYYCFGCGASGNAIGFVMEYEREGFVDAIESLATTVGIEVPREKSKAFAEQDFKRKKLYDLLEKAANYYEQQLREHPQKSQPVNYLKQRGLTGHIAKDFQIGFAPPGHNAILNALGPNEELKNLLVDAGLVIRKEEENKIYDRFRNRIAFPIRDERGRVIGFGGRVLGNDKPKYLNSPETQVFHKGRELYGLFEAKKAQRKLESLLVVEGYMDVIALAQYGVKNAVATLGTACGEDHLRLAFRFVSNVIFCFDGDDAGRTAAKRALHNSLTSMEDGRQIKFLFLPEGQDPDSLVRQIGKERFETQIAQSVPLEEFLFEVAAENIDLTSMDGRAKFSRLAAPLIAQLPGGIFRELMFDNLARRTGLSREVLNELQKEKLPEPPPRKIENKEVEIDAPPPLAEEEYAASIPQNYTPVAPIPQHEVKKYRSKIDLNPAKRAIVVLLEHPELLQKLEHIPDLGESDDLDIRNLTQIIQYLKKRPDSNFSSILGYWGGSKGMEQQQLLADLMANQFLSSIKVIQAYDPMAELNAALSHIEQQNNKNTRHQEIAKLKSLGLANLNPEQKLRLIELTRS